MKSIIKNDKAFHPAIMGIVMITIVAIVFGMMVMVYSNISSQILPNTFDTKSEAFNDTGATTDWTVLSETIASEDGSTAYSIQAKNNSETFYDGIDFNTTISNNSVLISNKAGSMLRNVSYTFDYSYEGAGTESARKIDSNEYKGFDLGSIAPIVLAAGLIITIVIGFGAMVFRRD